MQAARTGRARTRSKAVISKAHGNKGVISSVTQGSRIFKTVVIMFNEATIDDTPAICREITAMSTEGSF